ncbi:hypothetical protein GOA74_27935, partial [Sinorhizobium meliloti]|nr:hypothetical protein [Sinorhizobium meliloti]MDW9943152.1 hypothetical protein [Sinorhizobium meliloti]
RGRLFLGIGGRDHFGIRGRIASEFASGGAERSQVDVREPSGVADVGDTLPKLRPSGACRSRGDGPKARQADGHHQPAAQAALRVWGERRLRMEDGQASEIASIASVSRDGG